MLLTTLIPIALTLVSAVWSIPTNTNAYRIRRGLPLKPPATRVRRQSPGPSQTLTTGVDGVMQVSRRAASARRSLQEREAPNSGFMAFDGASFRWAASSADAAVIYFPTDTGNLQPLRVRTPGGLSYLSIVSAGSGLYELRTTPEYDGTSKFTWTSVTGQSGGSNVGARAGNVGISFRLDANNDKVVGSSTFASTATQNPVWLFVSTPPVAVTSSGARDAEVDKMVRLTNDFRAQYDAAPLKYNETIAAFAQSVADTCVFEHSGGNGIYGENLYYGGYAADADDAVTGWGPNEAVQYDYSNPGFSSATGHFTQLVWQATTQLGCGYKLCAPGSGLYSGQTSEAMYIVCNYYTQGNYGDNNQYAINVKRKVA